MRKRGLGRVALLAIALLLPAGDALAGRGATPAQAKQYLAQFREAVDKLNREHLASPGENTEADLAKKLPKSLRKGLDRLLAMEDGPAKWAALVEFGGIAADLDLADDLERVEKALRKGSPEDAEKLGTFISRPRFLLHGMRVRREFAERFAEVYEGILTECDKVFGFAELSKVPGKKIRIELHREAQPRAPHFAPQFPHHSTIDFPVAKDDRLVSPTHDGKMYFYGMCHELGHLMVMWGDRRNMEDHHAWAHYVGVTLVDACAKKPWAKGLRDVRWRSLEKERRDLEGQRPSRKDHDGVMRLLVELHDLVGPKKIGAAINLMEEKSMGHRINRVRYYSLDEFKKALMAGEKSRAAKKRIAALFE